MQSIVPDLWLDTEAGPAAESYGWVFPSSRIVGTSLYPEGSPSPVGTVMTVDLAALRSAADGVPVG